MPRHQNMWLYITVCTARDVCLISSQVQPTIDIPVRDSYPNPNVKHPNIPLHHTSMEKCTCLYYLAIMQYPSAVRCSRDAKPDGKDTCQSPPYPQRHNPNPENS